MRKPGHSPVIRAATGAGGGGPPAGDRQSDDAAAFAQAVRGARKLGGATRVALARPPLSSTPLPTRPSPAPILPGRSPLRVDDAGKSWTARADGVDRKVVRGLRRGAVSVEGQLDLHGQTRVQATRALDRFLAASRAAGHRCVIIIHGRGLHSGENGPALPDAVRTELTTGKHCGAVLACCTASPTWGGTGATVVLLRR